MKFREFPGTGVRVSEVGFGVWTVTSPWWGVKDDATGLSLMRQALDAGITFFDTSDNYGDGKGETLLAKALADQYDKITIGSKWGYDFYNNEREGQRELPQDFSVPYLKKAVENSLKRLKRDHIDIYEMHNPRLDAIAKDDVFEALEDLKREGKIRAYGVALGPAINERQIDEGKFAISYQKAHCVQIIYNLFEQMLGEGIFPTASNSESRFLVRVPHSSGLLEGNLTLDTKFSTKDHRSFRKREWLEQGLRKVEAIQFLLEENNKTLGQVAMQFVLSEPNVASVLPNIFNEKQIEEFSKTSDQPAITPEHLDELKILYANNFGVKIEAEPSIK